MTKRTEYIELRDELNIPYATLFDIREMGIEGITFKDIDNPDSNICDFEGYKKYFEGIY